ncbi:MAG: ATP-binding cassette domain-containing protein [Lachnospiraceae bacterium]|nr:ATP-binding cassette domain-containing protein [Lachnospiraceae bacterium]
MSTGNNIFTLRNVSKIFGSDDSAVKAVDNVSFDIRRGEIFGIIGMSGAGKSTLVRTLNRLEEITNGTVDFDGRNLGSLSKRELREARQSIAMIFQSYNLLMQKTVLANVIIPMRIARVPRRERKERALDMLRIVGLEDKAEVYPSQLSGGQRQRVAIARALTMNPEVLLCDEATSALDPKITEEILKLLKDINTSMGLTIVIITHEMKVVEKICDRVAIVDDGQIVELGDVKEIFTKPKTKTARQLIMPESDKNELNMDEYKGRCARVVFDGTVSREPIICSLTQETGHKVSILSANTKSVGGIGFGQMIIELPEDDRAFAEIVTFLTDSGVTVTELEKDRQMDSRLRDTWHR